VKAVVISHGIGMPTRRDVETDGKLHDGLYMHVDVGLPTESKFMPAAYIYAPEHADKAFDLLTRHWQEEKALKDRQAGEWNQLTAWRLKK
jgi:hypothetical protein